MTRYFQKREPCGNSDAGTGAKLKHHLSRRWGAPTYPAHSPLSSNPELS